MPSDYALSPVVSADVKPIVPRSNPEALQKAIEALGCPFVTTLMEKCVIDERHPQFAGMYVGAVSGPKTGQIVEGADLVLDLGGVNLNDITTAASSICPDLLPSVLKMSG